MAQEPTIGRIVLYRSKVGGYDLPAIITATDETLLAEGVERWRETEGADGVPGLDSPDHVHLTVFSPGISSADPPAPLDGNRGGSYREWNVPLFEPTVLHSPHPGVASVPAEVEAGTWRWPVLR